MKRNVIKTLNDLEERYVPVTETGCWLWTGCLHPTGYGVLKINSKQVKVHRLVHELTTGQNCGDKFVCHKCDTPMCINPDHLYLGTHADNTRDMVVRKRYNTTAANLASTKLTPQQTAEITADRRRQRAIAKEYGISQSRVSKIKSKARGVISHVAEDGAIPKEWLKKNNKDNNNND